METLVGELAEADRLHADWQRHIHKALVEAIAGCNLAQTAPQDHNLQRFVKVHAGRDGLQIAWPYHCVLSIWLKRSLDVIVCRTLRSATFSRLWSKSSPNVIVCRPLGNGTFSKLSFERALSVIVLQAARQRHILEALVETHAEWYQGVQGCHDQDIGGVGLLMNSLSERWHQDREDGQQNKRASPPCQNPPTTSCESLISSRSPTGEQ